MLSAGAQHLVHRRLRAPQQDRETLFTPATSQIAAGAQNFLAFASHGMGGPWKSELASIRQQARAEAIRLAIQYTSIYQDTSWTASRREDAPLIVGGHQPYLYHPGVWLKNFQLSAVAEKLQGLAINWIVDNDTTGPAEVRVPWVKPSASDQSPDFGITAIPIDHASEAMPYEERFVLDETLFASFAERLHAAMPSQLVDGKTPLIHPLWHEALQAIANQKLRHAGKINLGETLAQARHQIEFQNGVRTLELPLSWISRTRPFLRLSELILDNLPTFAGHYNRLLAHYRHVNKIRSTAHPMPDLAIDGDWHEAPFWIWTEDAPRRERLFLRSHKGVWALSNRKGVQIELDRTVSDPSLIFGDVLEQAERAGIKIRPRAIITTLFSRLTLGDAFIHGIGGAKYDELTDALMRDFFQIEPPLYQTVTATVRLPLPFDPQATQQREIHQRHLRDIAYRGEAFLDSEWKQHLSPQKWEDLQRLAHEKKEWISAGWKEGAKGIWHQQGQQLKEQLQDVLTPVTQHLLREAARAERRQSAARVLGSREFSIALFDQKELPHLLLDFCKL